MKEIPTNPEEVKFGLLLASIGRLHATLADRYLERIGLYRGQAMLLLILSHEEGLTHSEIAEKLEISPAAATKVIKRMEAMNYLQRRPDPGDERISRVYLLEEGRAIYQQIRSSFQQIDRILLEGFSPAERQQLVHLLLQVYSNLLNYSKDPE